MQSGSRSRRTEVDEVELRKTDVSGRVRKEFQSAEFGDERLTDRLMQVGDQLGRAPAESIPNACEDWASTKATYRFCDNERVDPNEILDAHKREQRSRIRDTEELLVISDTTSLYFRDIRQRKDSVTSATPPRISKVSRFTRRSESLHRHIA
jgi:hypothetical protein